MKRLLLFVLALSACQSPDSSVQVGIGTVPSEAAFVEARRAPDGIESVVIGGDGRRDALYQLGSISKFACTLAVLDMAEEGRVDLDASIDTLLPGYESPSAVDVTLRQLLSHRAGLADGVVEAFSNDPGTADLELGALEAANRFASTPSGVEPGSRFDYVISNWILVQAILEEADGQGIASILEDRVFAPGAMSGITAYSGRLASRITVEPSSPVPPIPPFLVCAGGVAATAEGLLQLVQYPFAGSGWSDETLTELTTVVTPDENYALGGRVWTPLIDGEPHRLIWLGGSNGAFKSRAVHDPLTGAAFAIVTNEDANAVVDDRREAWLRSLGDVE
jgi:CubicO group peptidase (beta-lactamase class C family)